MRDAQIVVGQSRPISKTCTRQKFVDRVKELNLVMNDTGDTIALDCPKGKVFVSTDCHMTPVYPTHGWKRPNLYAYIWADILALGVRDCTDVECEYCHPELYPELSED